MNPAPPVTRCFMEIGKGARGLLDRDALRQVAGFVDIAAAQIGDVV